MRMRKRWRPSLKGGEHRFFEAQEEEEEEGEDGEGDDHSKDGSYGGQRFDDEMISMAMASASTSASSSTLHLLPYTERERLQLDTNTGTSSHSYGHSYGYGLLHYFFTASDVSSPREELLSSVESVAASSSKGHLVATEERSMKEKGVDFHLQPRTPSPKLPSPGFPTEFSIASGPHYCPDLNLLPNPTLTVSDEEYKDGELDGDGDNTMTNLTNSHLPVFYEFLGLGTAAGVRKSKSSLGLIARNEEKEKEKEYMNIKESTEFCLFPSHMEGFNNEIHELQKLSTKESLIPRYNLEHVVCNTDDLQQNCNMHGKEWKGQTRKAEGGLFNIRTELLNGKEEVSKKVKVKKRRGNRKVKKVSDDVAAVVATTAPQQCNRKDGRGWQCSRLVKEGYTYCEHHLVKIKANHARSAMKMAMLRRSLKESSRNYHHNNTIFFGSSASDENHPILSSSSFTKATRKKLRYCFNEDGLDDSACLYPASSCVNLHDQIGTINLRGQTAVLGFRGQTSRVNFHGQTVRKRGMLMVDYDEDDDVEGLTCRVNSDPVDWRLDLC